jgi:hypothetical protein
MMMNTKTLEEKSLMITDVQSSARNIPSFLRSSEYSSFNCSMQDFTVDMLLFKSYSRLNNHRMILENTTRFTEEHKAFEIPGSASVLDQNFSLALAHFYLHYHSLVVQVLLSLHLSSDSMHSAHFRPS